MLSFFSRWATPAITGLFVVSLVSGVIIFFGIGRAYFTPMHEWLSMVLIVPFVLHLWKNWRPFLAYFRRPPMMIASVLSLIAALAFALPAFFVTRTPPPERAVIQLLPSRTVEQVAPLFGHTPDSLTTTLAGAGFTVVSSADTLDTIARASGKTTSAILRAAVDSRK